MVLILVICNCDFNIKVFLVDTKGLVVVVFFVLVTVIKHKNVY